MKKGLRVLGILTAAALLLLSLAACTGDTPADGGKIYKVGVVQLTQHPALDAATQGFVDALKDKLGDAVTVDVQNASNESANCTTIVTSFVSSGVDLILANATPALQAAAAATSTIPILGTSITDYATALSINNWTGKTGRNISGTSDLAPLKEQAEMVKELFPDKKKVGLLYCSGEANSVYQCTVVEQELKTLGYEVTWYSFADSNDMAAVAQTACDNSDVIYVPTDNTVADNAEVLNNIARPAGVPIVAGEENICKACGVATLSISYYDIGKVAGEMAYEILANGADVSQMDIKFAPEVTKKYNAALCEALGVTAPAGYTAIE